MNNKSLLRLCESLNILKGPLCLGFLIGASSLSSCTKNGSSAINEIKFDDDIEFVQLENWQFLGPFYKDSSEIGYPIDVDFLNLENGHKEVQLNESDLIAVAENNSRIQIGLVKSTAVGVNILDYVQKKEGAVYLFCTIKSRTDQDINFVFSGIQNSKVWLNNEYIYESEWKRLQFRFYEEYVPVRIKKGDNFLLLKIGISEIKSAVANWKFNFFASTNSYARRNFLKDYRFSILKESVIGTGMLAYLGPFINDEVNYRIFDNDSNLVCQSSDGTRDNRNGTISLDINSLKANKLYNIEFDVSGNILCQNFYYGAFDTIFNEISSQYAAVTKSNISDKDKLNLEASFKRLQFVRTKDTEPEKAMSLKAHWDRSRVLFSKELSDYFKGSGDGSNPAGRFDGFIKGYISSIDNSKQYYSSYIPKKEKQRNEKIPLVIICPFTYNPIPYLEYWSISNLEQIMWDYKLADEYGFGIVRVNLRGHPGLNEIGMTAFQEILEDVRSRYSIDEDRIFILGNSASSKKALTLATRFPTLIAGTIIYSPDIDMSMLSNNGYKIENLSNASLYMWHSKKDEMVPMQKVESLYEKMQAHSKGSILQIVDNSTHFITAKDSYRSAFEYIKDKRRTAKPDSITLSTSELKYGESYGLRLLEKQGNGPSTVKVSFDDKAIQIHSENVNRFELDLNGRKLDVPIILNGSLLKGALKKDLILDVSMGEENNRFPFVKNNLIEGPLNHAFASNFKIVFNERDVSIKDTLNKLWKKVYFNDALSLKDVDVTMQDINNSNLVLVGAKFNNKTIQNIVNQLPIKIFEDYILFRGRRFDGKNVFISFVYPNPINPDKYIVLIVSNGKLRSIPIKDFSNDGKSDYMIFDYVGDSYQISSSGNFDNNWQ